VGEEDRQLHKELRMAKFLTETHEKFLEGIPQAFEKFLKSHT
jgi:hypothetical protein